MTNLRLIVLALTVAAVWMGVKPPRVAAAGRPNIIVILSDDMGCGDLGCYGGKVAPTPNLDKLAAEGLRFTSYYSASPICSPSRAALVTGQFPARWRITSFLQTRAGNRGCEQADFLDPAAPSLSRQLKAAGYATAHFGKWHLGGGRDVVDAPKFAAYGYDEAAGTWESPEPHPDITAGNWIWSDKDKVKRWERSGFFVDRAVEFLKRHKGVKPCFVNLWPDDVHTPWVPAEAAQGDTRPNLKAVLVEYDRQVGRLMEGLREAGMEQDTLLIFTSDNGAGPFPAVRGAGLRGGKLSLYEGGIRMPFIVRWPGRVPAGKVDEQTVIAAVDLMPTLCAVAGAQLPAGQTPDGQDMTAALEGKPIAARQTPLFWEYGRNEKFFKFPGNAKFRSPNVAVRDGPWKLLVNADGSGAELYDMAADAQEASDVAAGHPKVVADLKKRALEWRKSVP